MGNFLVATSLPSTPYLVVDLDVLEANIAAMASAARDNSVSLRPHAKTHKCREIASRQLKAGAAGLTVATVSEAEIFVDAGCTDVFIAYPLWVDRERGARLRSLLERCSLAVGVDSQEAVEALGRNTAAPGPEVMIEVDSGHRRTGVAPDDAGRVAAAALRAGLRVRGVFTYPGHSYGQGMAGAAAADEARALSQAAQALRAAGASAEVLSGGSTPTARLAASPVTEIRPGVYVFNDAQQLELGSCSADKIALTAAATVVSRSAGRVVLDAGSKVLGADRAGWASGYGRLVDYPDARLIALSEHHATVSWPYGCALPELGAPLRVVPNHVCAAVNLADELVIMADGQAVERWGVAARGANN